MTHGRAAVLWLAWAVCGAVLDASAQQKPEPKPSAVTLEGEYRCEGKTRALIPGVGVVMMNYALLMKIEKQDGELYHITWANERGPTQVGDGFVRDDQLVASVTNADMTGIGVMSFKITSEGLLGLWTGGDGYVYREDCKRGGAKA